jgi:hypothetical protein
MDPITLVAGLGGLTMMYNFYNYYYDKKEIKDDKVLQENVDKIMEEILSEKGEKLNTIEDIEMEINKKNLLMELKNKQFKDNLNIVEDSDDIIEPDSEEYE